LQGDGVAEGFELADVSTFDGLDVHVSVVGVWSEVFVAGLGVTEQVPDDDEDGSTDGDEGLLLPASAGQAPVAGAEERVCRPFRPS